MGIARRPRGYRHTPELKQKVYEYYMAGNNYAKVKEHFHLDGSFVTKILHSFPDAVIRAKKQNNRLKRPSMEKEIRILFRRLFLNQKPAKIAKVEHIANHKIRNTIYEIKQRNKEVVTMLKDGRRELVEALVSEALAHKEDILKIFLKLLENMGNEKKLKEATLVQISSCLNNLMYCFGRIEETTVAQANAEAQEKLCGNIAEALRAEDWDDNGG